MAGNVSIVKTGDVSIGVIREQKEELLEGVGVNKATIDYCLDNPSNYDEPDYANRTTVASLGQEPVTVPRPSGMGEMWTTPKTVTINTKRKLSYD